jgi:Bifunctional DNA primase/polymerase, N-terminal
LTGLKLFPCETDGKRPLKGTRGFKDATADLRTIRDWLYEDGFAYNIATPTGTQDPWTGNDVLDVDQRGEAGSGFPALNRLKQAGLVSGAYLLVRTPSGGLHLHYTGTAQRSGRLTAEHLDFKAAGGYVLLPPSRVDGRPYELIDRRPPTGAVLDWEACKRLLSPPQPRRVWVGSRQGGSVGHLPAWLARQADGNRNSALHWAACRAAEAGDQEVLAELAAVAVRAGLSQYEALRTVASAVGSVRSDG